MTINPEYFSFDPKQVLKTMQNQRKCETERFRFEEGITFIFTNWSDKEPAIIEVDEIPEGYYMKYGGVWRFKSNPND